MGIWKTSSMTILFYSKDPSENYPCEVKIDGNRILVEYDDDGVVQYEGVSNGEGHFELNGSGFNGRASLHMFPGSLVLEGSWAEEGYRGMWKINLA